MTSGKSSRNRKDPNRSQRTNGSRSRWRHRSGGRNPDPGSRGRRSRRRRAPWRSYERKDGTHPLAERAGPQGPLGPWSEKDPGAPLWHPERERSPHQRRGRGRRDWNPSLEKEARGSRSRSPHRRPSGQSRRGPLKRRTLPRTRYERRLPGTGPRRTGGRRGSAGRYDERTLRGSSGPGSPLWRGSGSDRGRLRSGPRRSRWCYRPCHSLDPGPGVLGARRRSRTAGRTWSARSSGHSAALHVPESSSQTRETWSTNKRCARSYAELQAPDSGR